MAGPGERSVEVAQHIATLWRLARAQPHLLTAHAAAYAALAQEEAAASTRLLRRRALLLALCAGGLLAGTTFLGVALMLWATVPSANLHAPALLVAVPALPLLLAAWAAWALSHAHNTPLWSAVKAQAAIDLAVLRAHNQHGHHGH